MILEGLKVVLGRILRWILHMVFHIVLGKAVYRLRGLALRGFARFVHILLDRVFTWAFRKVF